MTVTKTQINLQNRYNTFIEKSNLVHNNYYEYSGINYINSKTKITIMCPVHGVFKQAPDMHVMGQGCPTCAQHNLKVLHEVFIEKAKQVHNNYYDYSLVDSSTYFNIRSKLPIICPKHGVFYQRGSDHNRKHGCPNCSKKSCSTKSLIWLDNVMMQDNIHIQHAGNGGEYRIPSTQFAADGYCADTNTVYEFDGDAYHGNPNRYVPDANCHPRDKSLTAKDLYDKTIIKHNKISELGYHLITIWESDFDSNKLSAINEYNDLVVSKTDNTYPEKLLKIGLVIIGEYIGAKSHHDMRCLKCGGIHNSTPLSKLQTAKTRPNNYGCPNCNKLQTDIMNRNRGNYENRLLELNYKAFGYKNALTTCLLECTVCGKQKTVLPTSIIIRNVPCCKGSKNG
jgi:hypothetical protein